MNPDYIIIDFDSTFITQESLDELAIYKLSNQPDSQKKLNRIKSITNAGMNGDMPFKQSIDERMELLNLNRADINTVSKRLSECVTPSFNNNKVFLNEELLKYISSETKGEYYHWSNMDSMITHLNPKITLTSEINKTRPFEKWWMVVILISILSLEWGIRRKFGFL